MKRIAGIPVTNAEHQLWTFILDNCYQAGAHFSKQDIQRLIKQSRQPMSHKRQAEFKRFNEDMDESYQINKRR